MLVPMKELVESAYQGGYAIGGFNVYNLEGAMAVVRAAEASHAPAILQIHNGAFNYGGTPLMALCNAAAAAARVPIAVHMDHISSAETIELALENGITSIMADGSHLSYEDNVAFSRQMVELVHKYRGSVEAELGRLAGTEDGLSVSEMEARMTDPAQAADFIRRTGIDALAVCIGNVHGHYWMEPQLDFPRLEAINQIAHIPLVLHGASGLPAGQVQEAISLGISKINVNTEVREAFVKAIGDTLQPNHKPPELLKMFAPAIETMVDVIADKISFLGSAGKAK